MICVIINPNNCIQLEDVQDIYKTEEECVERAIEIGLQVPYYYPEYRQLNINVKNLQKGD